MSSPAKVTLCTINMYTYVSYVGACEDGPTGTETCRRFYGIFSILMCVKCFRFLSLKTKDTSASGWVFDFVSYFLARYKNENKTHRSFGIYH